MRETILNPTFFDLAVKHVTEKTDKLIRGNLALQNDTRALPEALQRNLQVATYALIQKSSEYNASLRSAAMIAIGPATLDSLLEVTPEFTPDRINLPYSHMFFEFFEPYAASLPFLSAPLDLGGLYLATVPATTGVCPRTGQDGVFTARIFGRGQRGLADATLEFHAGNRREVELILDESITRADYELGFVQHGNALTLDTAPKQPLAGVPHIDTLRKLADLTVNLVNYINAHNVHVIPRQHIQQVLAHLDHGKKKRFERIQTRYDVKIRDGEYEEGPPTGRTWELTHRHYVRGHNRHYRNEHGDVYLTTWISPYIKGPPNAPWREHRYQLLADKLLRERARDTQPRNTQS